MKLLEHQSKTLLSRFGLRFTQAMLCASAQEARDAAAAIGGPVVLKAQAPFGGRGKAGAVLFAENPEDAHRAARRLLGMELQNHLVQTISVECKVAVARELYVGISWDTATRLPVAILSGRGGVDVEGSSEAIRHTFDPITGLRPFEARQMARLANLTGSIFLEIAAVIQKLADAFLSLDAVTIEINPLAEIQSGELIGLDARVELDDDAEFRLRSHLADLGAIESSSAGRAPTALEKEARKIDASDHRGVAGRVVEFDGDLALLIGGGGASLTVFDAIRRYNGRPANYCEVGGNPTEEKVAALTALLLNKPGVKKLAVIMNVVNNTRADIMARGVIEGIHRAGRSPREAIAVFRIPGSWEPEAKAILADAGVEALGRDISLDTAAKMAVERMNAARS